MKRLFVSVVLAASLTAAPLAYAAPISPPINDPLTDTLELWSSIAEALSSVGRDLASAFTSLELAVNKSPGNSSAQEPATPAIAVASFGPQQGEPATTSPQTLPSSTASATTTIVNYITNPIERVVEEEPLASSDFVTQAELAAALLSLSQKLTPEQTELLPQWVAADGNPSVPYAAVSNITNLSGVTISNATISGGSVPSSSLTGTIANAIDTATGEIDSLSGTDLTYTAATTTNATSTNLFASNIAAGALSVSGTTTLENVILSSLNCSTFGNGGKLTTDALGTVTCAADQGGSGSTVGGSDTEVQFNSGGSFQGSSSFIFASSTNLLTVTNASTTNLTASYASSTNLVVGNATSTNLFASLANFTTGVINSLSGSQLTYTAASTTNFSDTGTAYFGAAATTTIDSAGNLTVAGSATLQSATTTNLFAKSSLTASAAYFGATATSSFNNAGQLNLASLASAVLGVNSAGQVVATTTIGTTLLTGTIGTINGAGLSAGGTITITAASSTLLSNNNTWTGLQQFANASSTLETDWTLWLPNTTSVLLKTTGSGQVAAAIAGTDYQVPITASYPISFSGNNLSLAFGTTTANTFLQLQTLSGGASTTNLSASGEGYFATASTTNLTVSGSPSGFLQTNAEGIVSATSTFSAGSIFGTFLVANGGTGSTTLTGILKGNGTGAIQTAVGGTDYEFPLTFSTGLNRTGNTITNTGVLLLGSGYATTTGTSITLSTTTQSFNGLTIAQQITSPNGSDLLFTPTISGTLSNAGIAHSTIILNGVTLTLGDTNDTVTAASSTLLADNNTWTGLQQIQNASTSIFSAYGPAYFGSTATSSFDTSGNLNLASGDSYKINGTSVLGATSLGSGVTTASGLTSASLLATIGTITTGTWNGTTIAVAHGGTGATSTSGAQSNLGVPSDAGSGASGTWGINISGTAAAASSVTFNSGLQTSSDVQFNTLETSGAVGIGTAPGGNALNVNGTTVTTGELAFGVGAVATNNSLCYNTTAIIGVNTISGCTSDERLKTDVQPLDASTSLAAILALNPVSFNWLDAAANAAQGTQMGFIAQQVQSVFPDAIEYLGTTTMILADRSTTTVPDTLGLNYNALLSPIVKSIQDIASISSTFEQNLIAWLGNAENGITDLFAQNIHAQNELCVGSTCVTPAQFQAMVAAASASQSSGQGSGGAPTADGVATDTPPVIEINGDNPAIIQVGATYNDLGATITGPTADLNLSIETFVNGVTRSPVEIDTSQEATDTIDYVVTDQNGQTATSTRTVIIEPAQAPSIVPTGAASSTATTDDAAGTTTTATSTSS